MITLSWTPLPGADVVAYRVYRSMIGFEAMLQLPSVLAGLTMQLVMNGGVLQTITFGGTLDPVSDINRQLTGGSAYNAADPAATYFYLRSDVRTYPGSILIAGGTALVALNVAPRFITEKSEDLLIATVAAPTDPSAGVTFVDADGVSDDYYAISTIDHLADESAKAAYRQAVTSVGEICVLEGLITDMTGRRVADVHVTAHLLCTPQSLASGAHISTHAITVLSGSDGRYTLPVLQGAIVRLEIAAIGYSRAISVPLAQYALVKDLASDDAAQLQMDELIGSIGAQL